MFPNVPATPTPTPTPGMPTPQGDPSAGGFLKWLMEMMGYGIDKGTQFAQGDVDIKSIFAGRETTPITTAPGSYPGVPPLANALMPQASNWMQGNPPVPTLSPEASSRTQRALEAGTRFNRQPSPFPPFEQGTIDKYGPSGYRANPPDPAPPPRRQLQPTAFGSGAPPELSQMFKKKRMTPTLRPPSGVKYPTNPGPATSKELFENRFGK